MKSAMQELIEFIDKNYDWFIAHSPEYGVVPKIKKKATELLEKECQQIIDDFDNGQANHDPKCQDYKSGRDYYNQTYNTQQV